MESGTTGYSPEGQVVEVIFAKNLRAVYGDVPDETFQS